MDKAPELIAPCGIYCGSCSAYLARAHDLRACGIRMSYCTGCRARSKQCALLKKRCAQIRDGSLRFCSECTDFPCAPLGTLDRRYREKYHMSPIENLETIRDRGTGVFLREEEERRRCPTCGGTVSCHNGICFDCGLAALRHRKQYRWEDR